jgi:acetyl-CoA acetyltransferase
MARSANFHNKIAIVGLYQTKQARSLEGETSASLTIEAVRGALDDAGLSIGDVDGFNVQIGTAPSSQTFGYQAGGADYFWVGEYTCGPDAVIEAAMAIENGLCEVAVISSAQAGLYTDRASTAPWTRPAHEFTEVWGLMTPAEWALLAQRHMYLYGGTQEQAAYIASVIRNNGSRNPEAIYYGRGPFTPQDVLNSRMVADPYHVLDCATTSEGGAAIVMTSVARARSLRKKPVVLLGGGFETWGQEYAFPPTLERKSLLGKRSADLAFEQAGVLRSDVDVLELYDNFSWEIVLDFEAYGYCGLGEGADFATSGVIEPGGKYPIVTDGGTMSHSHTGYSQILQRVIQAARQLRGESAANQVEGARIALASWTRGVVILATN